MSGSNDPGRTDGDGANGVVQSLHDSVDSARSHVAGATSAVRDTVAASGDRLAAQSGDCPLLSVAGGVAIGVIVGALLPRTERETRVLGGYGRQIRAASRDAAEAARESGQAKFAEFGFDREHARGMARDFVDNIVNAAVSAGGAALDAARQSGSVRK